MSRKCPIEQAREPKGGKFFLKGINNEASCP